MAGALISLVGIASGAATFRLTVGSVATGGKVPSYYDGYAAAGSQAALLPGAFGSLSAGTFKSKPVASLYWVSATNHASNGTCYIEIQDSVSAGFLNRVTLNGASLGAIGTPNYNATYGTTQFQLGSSNVANPFGTSGTHTVVLR